MRARSRVLLSARARWLAQRSTVAACGATRAAKRSSALVEPKVPVATEDWSYHLRLGPAREATILIACLAALSLAIACSVWKVRDTEQVKNGHSGQTFDLGSNTFDLSDLEPSQIRVTSGQGGLRSNILTLSTLT